MKQSEHGHLFSRYKGFARGLAVGLVVGLLAGSAGMAAAALGKKGWDRLGPMFQQGYVAGFVDCVRIAQGLSPDGYIAKTYVVPNNPNPLYWVNMINELYKEKTHENRPLPQMMLISGHKLVAKQGLMASKDMRFEGLRQVFEAQQRAIREAAKTKRALRAANKEIEKDAAKAKGSGHAAEESDGKHNAAAKKHGGHGAADGGKGKGISDQDGSKTAGGGGTKASN